MSTTTDTYAVEPDCPVPVPLCWCGSPMIPKGRGLYPYDCRLKDRHPNAMIYEGCEAGHTCWKAVP